MTENNEFTRDDLVIDPEVEIDYDDPNSVNVYIETWFDVDEKFGIHTDVDAGEWVNMYGTFNPYEDKLKIDCVVSKDTNPEYFEYQPTDNEAQLIKDMITEKIREVCDCTPKEFIEKYGDGPTMGGI